MAVVSCSHNFVFVANPKAASTSVEFALKAYQEKSEFNDLAEEGFYTKRHVPAIILRSLLTNWEATYSFAIVRHPCDWIVSQIAYNAQRLGRDVPRDRRLGSCDIDWYYASLKDRRGQHASPTATQWAFLCDANKDLIVSRLINMSRLSREWVNLSKELGIRADPLPTLNAQSHAPARSWLSGRAKARTLELWARDYALYLDSWKS